MPARFVLLILLIISGFFSPVFSQWSHDANQNNVLSSKPGDFYWTRSTTDGAGGSIVAFRSQNESVNVQRIRSNGTLAWGTAAAPVIISEMSGNQIKDVNISDDAAGGAYITRTDKTFDSVHFDIYLQHVDSNGILQWPAKGVRITADNQNPSNAFLCKDGLGGVIIGWNYNVTYNKINVQRYNSAGLAQWGANPVSASVSAKPQFLSGLISDGNNGAVFMFERNDVSDNNIYGQRINSGGNILWGTSGADVCTASGDQVEGFVIKDDSGNFIFTFEDYRSGDDNIYSQKLNGSGVPQWISNGLPLETGAGYQYLYSVSTDSASGFVIAFLDENTYAAFSQRFGPAGNAIWSGNIQISGVGESINDVTMKNDGKGNFIYLMRSGTNSIKSQKLNANGALQWPAAFTIRNTFPVVTNNLLLTLSEQGNMISIWNDLRDGADLAIYTSKILNTGTLAGNYTTVSNGNWNDPATWLGGIVPPYGAQVVIANNVIVNVNTTCYSLSVLPAGNIHVNTGIQFTILN